MADLYVSDSTYAKYVAEYGDDAKDQMRSVLKADAPGGDADE
jgi:hypothetical protein